MLQLSIWTNTHLPLLQESLLVLHQPDLIGQTILVPVHQQFFSILIILSLHVKFHKQVIVRHLTDTIPCLKMVFSKCDNDAAMVFVFSHLPEGILTPS